MRPAHALQFLLRCITQAEADGYQQFEEDGNEVPDGATPDEWSHDGERTLWLVFGGEEFELTVRKKRRRV